MSVGKRLKSSLKRGLRDSPLRGPLLGTLSLVRRLSHAPAGIYTLCYHHVTAADRASFARQLDCFALHGTFISADQAVAMLRSGKPVNGRHFVLSADDGYADFFDVGLPELVERQIPAIMFIVPAWLDQPPQASGRADGYMTRADLESWCRAGMSIGSHSYTHAHLIGLAEPELQAELQDSAAVLAQLTGTAPRHFACPWGTPERDFEPALLARLAKAAGYDTVFTTTRGAATGPSDLLLMPRHVVEPGWPLSDLQALIGGYAFARRSGAEGPDRSEGLCQSSS